MGIKSRLVDFIWNKMSDKDESDNEVKSVKQFGTVI